MTSKALPSGTVGVPYLATLGATGGSGPYHWAIAAGRLPGGLRLTLAGVISGKPTAAGSFTLTVGESPPPPP